MNSFPIYNFYCIKTVAKPFYRLINHTNSNCNQAYNQIHFSNSEFDLKGEIAKHNRHIRSQIEIQFKNHKFYERCLYTPYHLNYDLSSFKNNQFDNKVQIVKNFDLTDLNTDMWLSLSVQNQTVLNRLYNILEMGSESRSC